MARLISAWVRNPKGILPVLMVMVATAATFKTASGQDWKNALEAEKQKNSARIAVIDQLADPIYIEYQSVQSQIAAHNASPCTYSDEQPNACDSYNSEALKLNEKSDGLFAKLKELAAEQDALIARNSEIDKKLKCVQLPVSCKVGTDCECSGCCGSWDGATGTGICQPSCN